MANTKRPSKRSTLRPEDVRVISKPAGDERIEGLALGPKAAKALRKKTWKGGS